MPARRRHALPFIALAGALAAPAMAQHEGHADHAQHQAAVDPAIATAIAASTRKAANVARDQYRHPAETLAFFGVTGKQTILEYFPGGGWYLEILAPLAEKNGGSYIGAQPAGRSSDAVKALIAADPGTYSKARIVHALSELPSGSVDTVLTFRNVHNMVMGGTATATFAEFFRVLKPGGVLGVVDHRLPENRDNALEKTSGYLKTSTVQALAEQAGFTLEARSEVNANPKDKADHAKGVWALPPTLANGETDRAAYLAIGESDRMTLRFRKPG